MNQMMGYTKKVKQAVGISASNKVTTDNTKTFIENTGVTINAKGRRVEKYYRLGETIGEGSMGLIRVGTRRLEIGESSFAGKLKGFVRHGVETVSGTGNSLHNSIQFEQETNSEEQVYAIKTIILSLVSADFVAEIKNEIEILQSMDHPNIVKAYETFEDRRKTVSIVLEHCSGGDLYRRAPYTEYQAGDITSKLLSAIRFLHSKNISHRDLKFENIMFENESENAEIKLLDFGLSKKYKDNAPMREGVGTIYTMSPQVLQRVYTNKADIWASGVIAYMLLVDRMPFKAHSRKKMVERILKVDYSLEGKAWAEKSDKSKDFIRKLIVLDPHERYNAGQALDHPWFEEVRIMREKKNDLGDEVKRSVKRALSAYKSSCMMKKMALFAVAQKSTVSEVEDMRKIFQTYDVEQDGAISLDEFRKAMKAFNYTEEEVISVFRGLDIDNSGVIQYTEFLAGTLAATSKLGEKKLQESFQTFDQNKTGYITTKKPEACAGKGFHRKAGGRAHTGL
mmetsp:Transcript_234/g.592  ORF Transcript_234/g.592 Transcript_234/m.592 type:complete len:509 (+) Transcript_234:115-1641(+)